MARPPAVFVDRDDTLMVDVKYCKDPEQVELMPEAAEGLKLLADAGFHIVVVTNQSGIGRGYFGPWELDSVNRRLREELRRHGADYHALYYCPHHPDEGCDCRKPLPGLILRAASELNLDLGSSFTIGDREMDVQAGKAAGTKTILIGNGRHAGQFATDTRQGSSKPDFVARDLSEAASIILEKAWVSRSDK